LSQLVMQVFCIIKLAQEKEKEKTKQTRGLKRELVDLEKKCL